MMMIILYSQLFANGCHNNYINSQSQAIGELAWSKPIYAKDKDKAEARLLITGDNYVIVDGMKQIFAFNKEGEYLWNRPKWFGSLVVLRDDLVYYTSASRKTRMEAVDLNNNIQLEDFWIPNVSENSYLVLFEPIKDGLIAQVQFTGGPSQLGKGFIVYKIRKGGLGFEWSRSYDDEESPLLPLVCIDKNILVTTTQNEVLVFGLDRQEKEPEPVARFPLPIGNDTSWVSCGMDSSLFWAGFEKSTAVLAVTDFKGSAKWRWQTSRRPGNEKNKPLFHLSSLLIEFFY